MDAAVHFAVAMQEQAGLDVVTDREWRRRSYIGVIAEPASGFKLGVNPADGRPWTVVTEPLSPKAAVHSPPIAIWTIKGSMEGVPRELDEVAYIDGASTWQVLWQVVLPLCKPAVGAAALLVFIHAWNEFPAGSVMVDARELKPIQPLLYQYIGFFGREWGPLTAVTTIAVIPIFFIYACSGGYWSRA